MTRNSNTLFSSKLLEWHRQQSKVAPFPWKKDRNPYFVWLFEVVMQQTRIQQGLPYFDKLRQAFPTIFDLAKAPEDVLFGLWKGLGYYQRARNLQKTAQQIAAERHGVFPNTYKDLLTLSGIGPYTAAAIASFAYDEDVAVLDGNVYRVLARYFGERETVFNARGKLFYQTLANELLPSGAAARFNQALMDLGSSICKPSLPLCTECPFMADCVAYRDRLVGELPTPKVRKELKSRYFYSLFLTDGERISLQKRTENDVWRGLYQGITIEAEQPPKEISGLSDTQMHSLQWTPWRIQKLSHVKAHFSFSICTVDQWNETIDAFIVPLEELPHLAVPRVIHDFLSENNFF